MECSSLNPNPFYLRDLLRHGADVNTVDKHGRSPLHILALSGCGNEDVFLSSLSHGADYDLFDDKKKSPLYYLRTISLTRALRAVENFKISKETTKEATLLSLNTRRGMTFNG